MLNSLSFCFSLNLSISPLNLNKNLACYSILGCRFFPFMSLSILCHSFLACRISAEKSAYNLMGSPLYVIYCFSFVAFNIFSLSLIFVSLITMCLCMFLLGFILYGTLFASCTWVTVSFPTLGKFSAIISSNIFSVSFSLSSLFGTTIMQMFVF